MNRAVAYCRFSSTNQREESIDAQIRAIEKYCKDSSYTLIKIYKDEATSGTSTKDREAFLEMILDSKKEKFEYVVVHKFDRFARNIYDHAVYEKKLNENGVKLISVLEQITDSPESIILKSLLTGMNEYYSKNLSRETKKGLMENALKCKHTGGIPPLGYDLDENRKYVVNEEEAKIVKIIFQLALEGKGYTTIADFLNKNGFKNKLKRDFKKTSIRDTLLNTKYIGTYKYGVNKGKKKNTNNNEVNKNIIIFEDAFEAIIEKEIFYAIQEKFRVSKKKPRKSPRNDYYLTGFCKCGLCNGTYSGGYRTINRFGKIYYGYECKNRKNKINACKNKSINKELIEEIIFDKIKNEIFKDENIEIITNDIINVIKNQEYSKNKEVEKCKTELEKLKNMSLSLLEKNLEGILLDNIFKSKNMELNERISKQEQKLRLLQETKQKLIEEIKIKEFFMKLKKDSVKINRTLIEIFIKEIKIFPEKVEITLKKFPELAKNGAPSLKSFLANSLIIKIEHDLK